jgi:hypothetical protein
MLDHLQLLAGHFGVIGNARRQTGGCRLVPCPQPGPARQRPDFGLGQPDLFERAADAKLPGRLAPRPVVAAIVSIAAVSDSREAARNGQL